MNKYFNRLLSRDKFNPVHSLHVFITTVCLALALSVGINGVYAQDSTAETVQSTVNINVASADTLAATLNGVGDARAQDIVRYREAYGPFTTVEQLTEVKGIGQSTIDKNRTLITLD